MIVAIKGAVLWSVIDLTRLPVGGVELFDLGPAIAKIFLEGVAVITPAIFKPYFNKKKRF
ncbi:hypothetical protein EFZ10_12200 [Tatumella sp. TA1]|nr:hypothetical protein EFZ10_12200 [Tatumella sp. TA1]